ncbi:hypothetical protein AB0K34_14175 [Actinomadura sp. NPDC049382]|uniref:hypothetical protein n=1 Tax=Actinomadura sp. NPDC049382 TaxID=3158220 RepID=UPI003443D376
MPLKEGDAVVVVEHDEATKTPLAGGRRHPGRVVKTEGIYIQVGYEDRSLNGGRTDVFYRDSLWRAWDGAMRWRLTVEEDSHVRT